MRSRGNALVANATAVGVGGADGSITYDEMGKWIRDWGEDRPAG